MIKKLMTIFGGSTRSMKICPRCGYVADHARGRGRLAELQQSMSPRLTDPIQKVVDKYQTDTYGHTMLLEAANNAGLDITLEAIKQLGERPPAVKGRELHYLRKIIIGKYHDYADKKEREQQTLSAMPPMAIHDDE